MAPRALVPRICSPERVKPSLRFPRRQAALRAPRALDLLSAAACLLAVLLPQAAGCAGPRGTPTSPAPARSAPAHQSRIVPIAPILPSPARVWRAEGEICVRLTRFESSQTLNVAGAKQAGGTLRIERAGAALELQGLRGTGPTPKPSELILEPSDPAVGLLVGETRYPGRLRVRPLEPAAAGAGAGLAVDNLVELEDYVAGVVARELQLIGSKPAELEAQAIASRSFALAQLAARGSRSLEVRLLDSTRDQAYRGRFLPGADPRAQQAAKALAAAIEATRGQILVEKGQTLDARFHAACGGRSASAADVFPEAAKFASLASVDCEICQNLAEPGGNPARIEASAKDISWRARLESAQLDALALKFGAGPRLQRLEPTRKDRGGRWLEVELLGALGARRVNFEALRKHLPEGTLGSSLVLSAWPRPGAPLDQGMMISGRGRGHGVGLCQNGCRGYAARGWSAQRILAHFYPGSAVVDGR